MWAQAYDAAGNRGDSAIVGVTALNSGVDVSNWRIVQTNESYTFYLPAGTRILDNGYVILLPTRLPVLVREPVRVAAKV